MTTYTRAELATRVLKDLGMVGAEETPTAVEQEYAEETVNSEIALLAAKGIGIVNGGFDSTPEEYLTALSRRIGLALAPAYGLNSPAEALLAMKQADRDLRILSARPGTDQVLENDYY